MRATLMTKPGCLLCDQMRHVLLEESSRFCLDVEERDVTVAPELAHLEAAVPLLLLDGVPTFRFRMTREALRRVLDERGCPKSSRPHAAP